MSQCHGPNYLEPYRQAVQQFGPGFHSTLWSSPEAQRLRFDVLIDLAGLDDCVVLDAGCGTGDFAQHLLERGVDFRRYVGIDAVSELIGAAKARNLPRCEFRVADLVHDHSPLPEIAPDFVCISGTLNTMDEATARDLVHDAFEAAHQGVVFNFLSDRTHERWDQHDTGPARRFDTVGWIQWALTHTSRVSFTQDYLDGHDATIMMRHD